MNEVTERVRVHATNLANNGAPHQTSIGKDILKVLDLCDVTQAADAMNDENAKDLAKAHNDLVTAASAAKALEDEIGELKADNAELDKTNAELADKVLDLTKERDQLRKDLDMATKPTEPEKPKSKKG